MSLLFVIPEFNIGGTGTPSFQFYRRGFNLTSNGSSPSWRDIILSGNTALTLVNAKANGLNYIKLFGACEQNGTPTPDTPMDIVCNNGVLKLSPNLFHLNEEIRRGVNLTINSDGAYVLNGTAQGASLFSIQDITLSAGTYQFVLIDKTIIKTLGSHIQVLSESGGINVVINMNSSDTLQTFTVSETLSDVSIRLRISQDTVYDNLVIKPMLVKSDVAPTTYIPYGSIYTDGTVETVEVHSENLVPLSSSTDFNFSNNILSNKRTDTRTNIDFFVQVLKDNTWRAIKSVGVTSTGIKEYTLDIPSGVTNIKIKHNGARADLVIATNFVLPEGSYTVRFDCLSYNPAIVGGIQLKDFVFCQTPYFNGGTATAEMLLKVGNYTDEQKILSGAVTRNVGVKVLDGTEAWVPNLYPLPNAYRICWARATATLGTIRYSGLFCTHFEDGGSASTAAPNKIFFANDLNINFPMTSDFDTIGKCLQYLADQYNAGTPVIVIYPLATPTTETVTGQPMSIQEGTNIVQITQASMDNLELEVSYKATT